MRGSYDNLTPGAVAAPRANIFARPAESLYQGPAGGGEAPTNEPHDARRSTHVVVIACLVAVAVATGLVLLVGAELCGDARRSEVHHLVPPTSTPSASGSLPDVRRREGRRVVATDQSRLHYPAVRRTRAQQPRPMATRTRRVAPSSTSAQRLVVPAPRTPQRSAPRPEPSHLPAPVAADAPLEFP
jgi:hypothetical protein